MAEHDQSLGSGIADGTTWVEFCDLLKQAGDQVLRPATPNDALTRAEGFRYLSRLLRSGLERHVEFNNPDFPVLLLPAHETVKMGADNPDNLYQYAVINGNKAYRMSGQRGTVHYISWTTSKGSYTSDGTMTETGFLDSNSIHCEPDGRFDIIVSVEKQSGNWLPIEPESGALLIRQTFLDRCQEVPAEITIAPLDRNATPNPLKPADVEQGLIAAAHFVTQSASLFTDWTESFLPKVNELPPADQDYCRSIGGDPNIFYYHSYWELEDDEALVIELEKVPDCETWNCQVDNYWMESLDYRYHRIHFNKHTAKYNEDGSVTMVLAHEDPGVENWLETAGHRLGTLCFRWVKAREIVHPSTRVVPQSDVKKYLAS
ncbi:MAG: DUF1214 domain-containing protein [Pseudomonadales bacterium]